jgi:phosphohistidine phosphatase SixA
MKMELKMDGKNGQGTIQELVAKKQEPLAEGPAGMQASKTVFVIRHGQDGGQGLSGQGREQIRQSAEMIKSRVSGKSIAIWSSPAERAKESAEILSKILGVAEISLKKELERDLLGMDENNQLKMWDEGGLWKRVIFQGREDILILVTHLEEASKLSRLLRGHKDHLTHAKFFEAEVKSNDDQ